MDLIVTVNKKSITISVFVDPIGTVLYYSPSPLDENAYNIAVALLLALKQANPDISIIAVVDDRNTDPWITQLLQNPCVGLTLALERLP